MPDPTQINDNEGPQNPDRRRDHCPFPGQDRRGRRPKRGINWFLGVIASVVTIAGGTLALRGCVPETMEAAAASHEALGKRIDGIQLHDEAQDKQLTDLRGRLDGIERTGEKAVNLQLRAAIRSIDEDLRKLGPAGPGRANLERQRDQTCTDLSDSNAKLNYPRERCAP